MPRLITPEEAAKKRLAPTGKKHPLRAFIESLNKGDKLYVSPQDFKWKKRTPNYFCLQLTKKYGSKFLVEKDLDKGGWVVTRLE